MQKVTLDDRTFRLYLKESQIQQAIKQIAEKINNDYIGKCPLLVPILNGSFMFAADLMKQLLCDCHLSFIKVASYQGVSTDGKVASLIGLNESIEGRHVIILEDIVDSGHTLAKVLPSFREQRPASLKVATLLHKPNALKVPVQVDYSGIEIPNDFIVGFGLDYNGFGRNLRDIYVVDEG
ncbi:MAG: hypoxanthine phosphoribosyltransferase [Chitinophagales bacterium]